MRSRAQAWATTILLPAVLVACGGGGGGDDSGGTDPLPSHAVGGTVTGLSGGSLVLSNNGGDTLTLTADGAFSFATKLQQGLAYTVAVQDNPVSPAQTCTVASGTGQVGTADVTSVRVSCSVNTYRLGGNITGLEGTGLVLREANGETLAPAAGGAFAFASKRASASNYDVSVQTQPANPSQTCSVGGGTGKGTVGAADVSDIAVVCSTNAYTIGGRVSGLIGSGLVLQDNAGDDLPMSSDGQFVFPVAVASGAGYKVTVKSQPQGPTQTCTVSNGMGLVTTGDVSNVAVLCSTNTFAIHGTVSGLAGTGLVLQDNGADDIAIAKNGDFVFPTGVASGASYAVTVRAQPSNPTQTCTVSANGTGPVTNGDITGVTVVCSTNSYAISGSVSGLWGSGLVLQNNGGDDITAKEDGSFSFPTKVASGANYAVSVRTQPILPRQVCTVANAAGSVQSSDVSNVRVSCVASAAKFGFMTREDNWTGHGFPGYVTPYRVDPSTGALVGPGTTVQSGTAPTPLAVTPSGAFAYTANNVPIYGDGTVSSFLVDPVSGALTVNGPNVRTGGYSPRAIAIHPSGKFVYVANEESSSISAMSIDAVTGRLTLVGRPTDTGWLPRSIAIHPTGRFLYVAGVRSHSILTYAIDSTTGALSFVHEAEDHDVPYYAVVVHPSGRYAFSANIGSSNIAAGQVFAWSVNQSTGALTPINGAATGLNPYTLSLHPSGKFVYVASRGESIAGEAESIAVYTVDPASGQLTPNGPPKPTGVVSGSCFNVDPSGHFAYLANGGPNGGQAQLWTYAINPTTGNLLHKAAADLKQAGCVSFW